MTRQIESETSWMDEGACRAEDVNIDVFFPEQGESPREARLICFGCVVREECSEYAIRNHEYFGVWGGMTEQERRSEVRRRRNERKKGRL